MKVREANKGKKDKNLLEIMWSPRKSLGLRREGSTLCSRLWFCFWGCLEFHIMCLLLQPSERGYLHFERSLYSQLRRWLLKENLKAPLNLGILTDSPNTLNIISFLLGWCFYCSFMTSRRYIFYVASVLHLQVRTLFGRKFSNEITSLFVWLELFMALYRGVCTGLIRSKVWNWTFVEPSISC